MANTEEHHQTLEYVRAMLDELAVIARRGRYGMVAYMIEMASVEATDMLRGDRQTDLDSPRHNEGD